MMNLFYRPMKDPCWIQFANGRMSVYSDRASMLKDIYCTTWSQALAELACQCGLITEAQH